MGRQLLRIQGLWNSQTKFTHTKKWRSKHCTKQPCPASLFEYNSIWVLLIWFSTPHRRLKSQEVQVLHFRMTPRTNARHTAPMWNMPHIAARQVIFVKRKLYTWEAPSKYQYYYKYRLYNCPKTTSENPPIIERIERLHQGENSDERASRIDGAKHKPGQPSQLPDNQFAASKPAKIVRTDCYFLIASSSISYRSSHLFCARTTTEFFSNLIWTTDLRDRWLI